MGILDRLFRRKNPPPQTESCSPDLAFVLLSNSRLPGADSIIHNYRDIDPTGVGIHESAGEQEDSTSDRALMLKFDSEETVFVALVPAPVPNREADEGAQFSVSSLGTGWKLPEHSAHLIVAAPFSDSRPAVDRLSRFTSLLASVVKSSDAVGVYWGNAGATHDPEFFVSVARDREVAARIMLWTGLSIAREEDGRLSLLSLGMKQLALPDLLLIASNSAEDDALETFFSFLAYIADRGVPLPEGDTFGRTAEERLPVCYIDSFINPGEKVWRVEIP